jgi:hypothetical protein
MAEPVLNQVCSYCNISKPFTDEFYYTNGRLGKKCRKCKNKKLCDKPLKVLNDDWKSHKDCPDIYFERDTSNIYNKETNNCITNLHSFTNITRKNAKNIKWEIFNGDIPENKIVKTKDKRDLKSIVLDDLECVYLYCNSCDDLIENPDLLSKYCSDGCKKFGKNKKEKDGRSTSIRNYLRLKYYNQKNINKRDAIEIDYDLDYLINLGTHCFYCNIECSFGKTEYNPDALTTDRKNSDIGYLKENITPCCWFCNISKNITIYSDWMQYINFIKNPEILELDLSNKPFGLSSRDIDASNIHTDLRRKSPKYYPNIKDPKNTFLELIKKQNYKDSIFNFFPIIYLNRNCLFNASVDAIDSSLPENEKHRPDNLQIIPKCFNYGKRNLTNCQFLKEWEKRGFKMNFTNCSVKLPEGYEKSYFNKTFQ